jgi:hypothetical protein
VAGWVAATSRSPPTSHRELVLVFAYRQLTKPVRFADTLLARCGGWSTQWLPTMVLSETSTLVEFEPTAISGCTRGHTVYSGTHAATWSACDSPDKGKQAARRADGGAGMG